MISVELDFAALSSGISLGIANKQISDLRFENLRFEISNLKSETSVCGLALAVVPHYNARAFEGEHAFWQELMFHRKALPA